MFMLRASEIEQYLSTFNQKGRLNEEEGFLYGSGDDEVRGICVMWMATAPALAYAAGQDCNLIVCHEAVTLGDYPLWADRVETEGPWACDVARTDLIERHRLTILRGHSTVDPTHVGPALWDILELPAPRFSGWAYSLHTVEPITVARLAERVRSGLGLDHVRVTGDPMQTATEVGTAWGGVCLDRNMHIWLAHLLPRGMEVLIAGEVSDFSQRVAAETGIPMIEAGHSPSEDPGLRRLAEDIGRAFPDTKAIFRPQEVPWVTL
jgi:putative NIF3 family GTP cyclohydrolase 1 type 2